MGGGVGCGIVGVWPVRNAHRFSS